MKVSLSRILFPTDFSSASESARNYACAIAGLLNAELHTLHVLEDPLPIPGTKGSWVLPHEELLSQLIEQAQTKLADFMKNSRIRDTHLFCTVKVGYPVHEITEYAAKNQIDLIVLGTHGRTGLSHLLIGSVTEKVLRLSKCPVLTVHPTGHQFLLD